MTKARHLAAIVSSAFAACSIFLSAIFLSKRILLFFVRRSVRRLRRARRWQELRCFRGPVNFVMPSDFGRVRGGRVRSGQGNQRRSRRCGGRGLEKIAPTAA